jgi:hypothetical protein
MAENKDIDFSGLFDSRANLLDQRKAEERRTRRQRRRDEYKELFAKGFTEEFLFAGPERRRKQQLAINLAEAENIAKDFNMEKRLERQAKRYAQLDTIMNHPVSFEEGVRDFVVENVIANDKVGQAYQALDLNILGPEKKAATVKAYNDYVNNYTKAYTDYWSNIRDYGELYQTIDEGKAASSKLLNALSANAYYESEKGVGIFGAIGEELGFNSGETSKLKGMINLAQQGVKDYKDKMDDLFRVPILDENNKSNIETYITPASAVTKNYEAESKTFAEEMTRVIAKDSNKEKDRAAAQTQEVIGTVGNEKLMIGEDVSALSQEDKDDLPRIEVEGFNLFKGKVRQRGSIAQFFGADEFGEQVSDERSTDNYEIRRKRIIDGKVSYEVQNISMEAAMASYLPKIADQLKAQDIDQQTGRPRQEGNKYYYYNLARDTLIRNGNIYIRPSDTNNTTEGKVVFDLPANVVDLSAGKPLPKDGFGITDFLYTKMQLAQDKNSLTQMGFFDKAINTEISFYESRLNETTDPVDRSFTEGKLDLLKGIRDNSTEKTKVKYIMKNLIKPISGLENSRVIIERDFGIENTRLVSGTISKQEAENGYLSYINEFNNGEDDMELFNIIYNKYR